MRLRDEKPATNRLRYGACVVSSAVAAKRTFLPTSDDVSKTLTTLFQTSLWLEFLVVLITQIKL
jgi:hypothetical protein